MRKLFIEALQIHDSEGPVNGYWLQTMEGFDAPEYRISEYDKPGEDGMEVTAGLYGGRPIVLEGKVKGEDPTEYLANRRALISACAIKRDSYAYPIPTRISFETLDGRQFFLDGFFRRPAFTEEMIIHCKFLLQFTAKRSYIYDPAIVNSGNITVRVSGGVTLPATLPMTLSPSSGGSATVNNPGNAPSLPTIRLYGPLSNPAIGNATAGITLQLDYIIPSGSYVDIDMAEKTILLNGSSTLLSTKTGTSDWFPILPGVNNLTLENDTTSDTGYATVTFNPAYLGT